MRSLFIVILFSVAVDAQPCDEAAGECPQKHAGAQTMSQAKSSMLLQVNAGKTGKVVIESEDSGEGSGEGGGEGGGENSGEGSAKGGGEGGKGFDGNWVDAKGRPMELNIRDGLMMNCKKRKAHPIKQLSPVELEVRFHGVTRHTGKLSDDGNVIHWSWGVKWTRSTSTQLCSWRPGGEGGREGGKGFDGNWIDAKGRPMELNIEDGLMINCKKRKAHPIKQLSSVELEVRFHGVNRNTGKLTDDGNVIEWSWGVKWTRSTSTERCSWRPQ